MIWPKFGTNDVMMTSFKKPISYKSWSMKDGVKIKDLARIQRALPKFFSLLVWIKDIIFGT